MKDLTPTFTDITNWELKIYTGTTGSRSKKIVFHPETHDEYFIKGSKELENGTIKYDTEFWSEIVSSKVGQMLGFEMLDYNIGFRKGEIQPIGCLSKSMVIPNTNSLTEGITYLTGYDAKYNPEKDKKKYTFQFIEETLDSFSLNHVIPKLLEVIVFDGVIGNSDRHQENWGIITHFDRTMARLDEEIEKQDNPIQRGLLRLWRRGTKSHAESRRSGSELNMSQVTLQSGLMVNEFSLIYDSGCCLGREKPDNKVEEMLNNKQMMDAYLRKGVSEIHWKGESNKLNHFDLIAKVKEKYPNEVKSVLKRVEDKYSLDKMTQLITNVDNNLPLELEEYKLSENRKQLMIKLIHLRIQRLLEKI